MKMSPADRTRTSNRGIYHEIVSLQQSGRRAALATPIRLGGSVPFARDAKLLVRDDGSIMGTVGGGLLEAEVLRQAPEVIAADTPRVLEFDLTQDQAAGAGMICGGRCVVLIEPIRPDRAAEVYAAAARAEAEAGRAALITILPDEGGFSKLALLPDGLLVGSSGDAETDKAVRELAERCSANEEPCFVEQPVRTYIQPLVSSPSLYIFGAGHVAIPVAHLADLVDFRVIVIDDRAEFANTQRFPRADQVLVATVEDAFAKLAIGEGAYVVAITRGHVMDEDVVAHALRTPATYIGMIGSKRKVATIRQRLLRRGFSDADLARLHAPIGIDIAADTVEEIALSIVAEVIAVRRGAG
jgi:xanthine dehydrogenase accessory factor